MNVGQQKKRNERYLQQYQNTGTLIHSRRTWQSKNLPQQHHNILIDYTHYQRTWQVLKEKYAFVHRAADQHKTRSAEKATRKRHAPCGDAAVPRNVRLVDEVGDQHPQHGDAVLGRLRRVVRQQRGEGRSRDVFPARGRRQRRRLLRGQLVRGCWGPSLAACRVAGGNGWPELSKAHELLFCTVRPHETHILTCTVR